MSAKKISGIVAFSKHGPNPQDLLNFVDTKVFEKSWCELGLDDEADLTHLQLTLMANPKKGDVIKGTGGIRKLRYSPPNWKSGKRGALRICYVYFETYGLILMLLAYPKSALDDLTQSHKQGLKQLVEEAEQILEKDGPYHL